MKDIKILIVPDVHGRDFWREPVMENLDKEIIFLGDYVDPYPIEGVSKEYAFETLKEILELRKEHDNITLLIGNHDAGYINDNICSCRRDRLRYQEIGELFKENENLFDVAKEKTINKKRFLFSHAGIHFNSWIKYCTFVFPKGFRVSAKSLNELFHSDDKATRHSFEIALSDISYYRGGYEAYGSMIWADIREFVDSKDLQATKKIQVVGHTMCSRPINLKNKMYNLDCQKVFYIDSEGCIRDYETDTVVEETN